MIKQYDEYVKVERSDQMITVVDESTGEIKHGYIHDSKGFGDIVFFKVFRRGRKILKEAINCSNGYDLFEFMAFKMGVSDNVVELTIAEISEELSMNKRTTERMFARFQEHNLIVRKGNGKWMVNPYVTNKLNLENEGYLFKLYFELKDKQEKKEMSKQKKREE